MTRDSVIAILKSKKEYVSGEEISRQLGISRAAVNAAIKALRADGYEILSSTNKGYLLNNSPDILTAGELMALLPAERMKGVLCLESVDSTNNYLRTMAQNGAQDGQVVIADAQSAGRGRLGRSFLSPGGSGVYLSVLLRPDTDPGDTVSVTAWVAVAVCRAVWAVTGVRPGIKWVNDLILNNKKLCGILTEMSVESESGHVDYVIVGIGINVNSPAEELPAELRSIVASLQSETGKPWYRAQIAAQIIQELDRLRAEWPREKRLWFESYKENCVTLGRQIRVISGKESRTGTAVGLSDDFGLLVKYDDGESEVLRGGEVSVRGLCGYV